MGAWPGEYFRQDLSPQSAYFSFWQRRSGLQVGSSTRGRGRKLPRYKLIKQDKNDLKKLRHLLFYSMPLARKFAEHLKTPEPNPGRQYLVTEGNEAKQAELEDEELLEEEPELPNDTDNTANKSRKREAEDDAKVEPAAKLARLNTKPTFPFEDWD